MPNLLILAGIPGCGKSTWAKTFLQQKYTIVSSDEIRKRLFGSLKAAHEGQKVSEGYQSSPKNSEVFDIFHREIEDCLKHGVDVIADATSLTKRSRTNLMEIAWKHDAKVHLVLFKNVLEATQRNAAREPDQVVPEAVMEGMVQRYYNTLAEIIQEPYDTVTKIEAFQ